MPTALEATSSEHWCPDCVMSLSPTPDGKLCVIDLEQVGSRRRVFLGCLLMTGFLDNQESGDLHTNNRAGPGPGWTGRPQEGPGDCGSELLSGIRIEIASKRGGHLSNYFELFYTMARR